MTNLRVIETGDGSKSLLNVALDETYHSRHGAIQESLHVFIAQGFNYHLARSKNEPIRIFEVGFGTGLNAFLTARHAFRISKSVAYTSIETFLLQEIIWQQLDYASSEEDQRMFHALHACEWGKMQPVSPFFTLTKEMVSLQEIDFAGQVFDIVFFDAFAPNKQPEMWTSGVLEKTFNLLADGGVFVTYCAKGQLKRDLRSIGFAVETLPGPPGKKEMVRAIKPSDAKQP